MIEIAKLTPEDRKMIDDLMRLPPAPPVSSTALLDSIR